MCKHSLLKYSLENGSQPYFMSSTLQNLDFLERLRSLWIFDRKKKIIVAEYTAKFDDLTRYAPTMVATDDARKMKYMHDLSVEILTQVDSGEVGPRTYPDAVQRALRINGWILINKPTFAQSVAEVGGNTNVQKLKTRKFHPRRDRS